MRRARLVGAALLMVTGGCASMASSPTGAVISRAMGRDDRLVVRAHDDVVGVAVSARFVYVRSTSGLFTYDRVFARWLAPSAQAVDESPPQRGGPQPRFLAMAADPVEEAVWIGVPGAVLIYRPRLEQLLRVPLAGEPELIAFGGDGEAVVWSGGQWTRVSRAGFAEPLPSGPSRAALTLPPSLEALYARHPALRAQLPFLLRGAGALAARITTAATAPDRPGELWVGTLGDGVWQVDATMLEARPVVYGLDDEQVGALAIGASGVWSAGQGRARPYGLSFVQEGLQGFARRVHPGLGTSVGMRVQQLAVRGRVGWLATDRGLWRLPLDERGPGLAHWGLAQGLPDAHVTAVLPRTDGTWVGTRRGLAFVANATNTAEGAAGYAEPRDVALPGGYVEAADVALPVVQRLGFVGETVRALAQVGDQLYVGTASGLYRRDVRAVGEAAQRVAGVPPRPVDALAWHDSVLLVVSERSAQLLPLTAGGLVGGAAPGDTAREGSVARVELMHMESGGAVRAHVDARSIWIAGAAGVLAWRRDRLLDVPRVLRAGVEVSAEVTDLALGAEWAWVGTREGVVRVRRAAEGGLP